MKAKWAIALGNLLEHYSTALYALLVPFLVPLFFPFVSPITGLIYTYALIPISMLAKPLGALCFGWLGDSVGRKESLFLSLSGTAICTALMGFLPTYKEIGTLAPIFLALCKAGQKFFSAGESSGGAILLLENIPEEKRSLFSSIYDATTIVGMMVASFLTSIFVTYTSIESSWRVLFWLGSVVGLFAFILRKKFFSQLQSSSFTLKTNLSLWTIVREKAFLAIFCAAGFSQVTFAFSFTFLHSYLPQISSFSPGSLLTINSYMLLLDLLLLPIFGFCALRWGKEKIMRLGLIGSIFSSLPLFLLLTSSSLWFIGIARFFFLFFGAAFAAPLYAWALEKTEANRRGTTISLAHALGGQLLGAPASAISLWLFQKTEWVFAPAFYTIVIGLFTWYSIQLMQVKERKEIS